MATYVHNANYPVGNTPWFDVEIGGDTPPLFFDGTLVVLANSDGTETRIIGNGFTFDGNGDPTAGTITEVRRTDTGGGTIYEQVTALSVSLVALLNTDSEDNSDPFNLIFANVDTLTGNTGDDFLLGGPGGDALNGGSAGIDIADYASAPATSGVTGIIVSLGNPANNTGHAFGDTYNSIEGIRGSAFDDFLNGNSGNNVIYGGNGFDVLRGFGGNDTLYGGGIIGTGLETVAPEDYRGARAEYRTDLGVNGAINAVFNGSGATVTGVDVGVIVQNTGTDTLINVQQVSGTESADTFSVTSDFAGLFGSFAEFEGRGGNDTITGNNINTRISFANASASVTVDLATQTMSGGGNTGTDTFSGVRQVRGSGQADNLSAVGVEGDIIFIGQGGNDTLTGSGLSVSGRDSAQAWYDNSTSAIAATLSSTSQVTGATVGTDTLVDIFVIRGSDLNDVFSVDGLFDGPFGNFAQFQGMDGDDTFTGNGSTRASYDRASSGVSVTITAGGAGGASSIGPDDQAGIGVDTFLGGIRQVQGSNYGDIITGSNDAVAERFRPGAGNDTVNGGGGTLDFVDFLRAEGGAIVNLATNTVTDDGFGDIDTLSGIEGVTGSDHNDTITGDNGVNYLQGQGGDDIIFGGGGNDVLAGDDDGTLPGNPFGVSTRFDVGNDTLDGGAGADTMIGGQGNDTYVVDDTGDVVTEAASEGTDLVQTSRANYALSANVENLTGTLGSGQSLAGNVLNNIVTGGSGNDVIEGFGGSDTLNGEGGDDVLIGSDGSDTINGGIGVDALIGLTGTNTLSGGADDDVYYSGSASDVLVELAGAGEGNDVVVSNHSITLSANVERVILTGAATTAIGNGSDNLIFGLESSNGLTLDGGDGNDIVYGSQQSDTLMGGTGIDTLLGFDGTNSMTGGAGDDTYYSYSASDTITELAGVAEGHDLVLSTHDITLSANVEDLQLFGLATTGIGNGEANNLFGLGSGNGLVFNGLGGADVLIGSNQADLLEGGTGNDFIFGAGGADAFQFKTAGFGNDTVTDFVTTVVDGINHDYVDLRGLGESFGSLGIDYSGAGATITIGADTIFLTNVTAGLQQSDFLF